MAMFISNNNINYDIYNPMPDRSPEVQPEGRGRSRSGQGCDYINCAMINLHKSRLAASEVTLRDYSMTMITEPSQYKGRVTDLKGINADLYGNTNSKNCRACIRVNKNLHVMAIPSLTSNDICSIELRWQGKTLIMVSAYMDINLTIENEILTKILERYSGSAPLVIGMDSNAHNPMWGSEDLNSRGEDLELLMERYNMYVVNTGNTETFVSGVGKSIIDLLWCNDKAWDLIHDWKVDTKRPSLSDHRYILFKIKEYKYQKKKSRNLRNANWVRFQMSLEKLKDIPTRPSTEDLDSAATNLETGIMIALNEACPHRIIKTGKASWWSKDLASKREELSRLYRFNPDCQEYKDKLNIYRKEILASKRDSWKKFTTDLTGPKDIIRAFNFAGRKDPTSKIGLLVDSEGNPMSAINSLEKLMQTHFPESKKEIPIMANITNYDLHLDLEFINEESITWAFNSFGSHKAAGMDEIKPIILKNLNKDYKDFIISLYKWSIRCKYVPKVWRTAKVVFIPKPGKDNYADPKSYRPITLSTFLLKGLERLIQWEINYRIIQGPLTNQHAYTAGYSTETALSTVVDLIESAVYRKEKALVVSFDCTGAFDYIKFQSAKQGMEHMGVPSTLTEWYCNLLENRVVWTELQGVHTYVVPTRGSPQGGVLSPLIWNLTINSLLSSFKDSAIKIVGYADDVILIIRGKCLTTMVNIMQQAVNKVMNWGVRNGLTFNPAKTQVTVFSNKKVNNMPNLHINGTLVNPSYSMKYLGIILDYNLSWNTHINEKVKKASQIWSYTKRMTGKYWGLDPQKMTYLYDSVIIPLVNYGSIVWANKLTQTQRQKLTRVQRKFLLSITSSMRSTPTSGIEAIMGVKPLDLKAQEDAAKTRWRIKERIQSTWDGLGNKKGHQRHWDDVLAKSGILGKSEIIPRCMVKPVRKGRREDSELSIFTDGSKNELGTGAGWIITNGDIIVESKSIQLNKTSSVFQAEVTAILDVANFIIHDEKLKLKRFQLWTDSRAALGALTNPFACNILVKMTRQALEKSDIWIAWVRGHSDNTGNEVADYQAKEGILNGEVFLYNYTSKCIVKNKLNEHYHKIWSTKWQQEDECKHVKHFLEKPRSNRYCLKYMNKHNLNLLIQMITGHGLFRGHLAKWQEMEPTCNLCQEEKQTGIHLWRDCPALEQIRRECSNNGNLDDQIVQFYSRIGRKIKT